MWACETGVFVNIGAQNGEMYFGAVFCFVALAIICMLLFSRRNSCCLLVFLIIFRVRCYWHCFLMAFTDRQSRVASCVMFFCSFVFLMLCNVFF